MSRLRWPDSTNSVSEKPGRFILVFLSWNVCVYRTTAKPGGVPLAVEI